MVPTAEEEAAAAGRAAALAEQLSEESRQRQEAVEARMREGLEGDKEVRCLGIHLWTAFCFELT